MEIKEAKPENKKNIKVSIKDPKEKVKDIMLALNKPGGSISGIKFYDLNRNKVKDGKEPGIAGWSIHLGKAFKTADLTIQTGFNGEYTFSDLAPGEYYVWEDVKSGWVQIHPPSPGYHKVTISSGDKTDLNFGNCGDASIKGKKFEDADSDGKYDPGETLLKDWTIKLLWPNTNLIVDTETTDSNGEYVFENLAPETHYLEEEQQNGWTQTLPTAPNRHDVDVPAGNKQITGKDFGNKKADSQTKGKIKGVKFYDMDGDKKQGANEPGLPGWTIELEQGGKKIAPAITGQSGDYEFSNLNSGNYVVKEVIKSGWKASTPVSQNVNLPAGNILTVDFGNQGTLTLSGFKFDDVNNNKIFDNNEKGLGNWRIELRYGGILIDSKTTAPNGAYSFSNLAPGAYDVSEVQKPGWTQTAPAGGTHSINLNANTANLNFGNRMPAPPKGSISGLKFEDRNANGNRDPGENGLSGWTIQLKDLKTGKLTSTKTGGNGAYNFANLPPGSYGISEQIQKGWRLTAPNSGAYIVNLQPPTMNPKGIDFGNVKILPPKPKPKPKPMPKPLPKPLPIPASSITGVAYYDINGNGNREPNEPPLPGWKILLEAPPGKILQTSVADKMGAYSFQKLPPGSYIVHGLAPMGWAQTEPRRGAYAINLIGQNVRGIDFGNRGDLALAGSKFYDLNLNGKRDRGEPGMPGWPIQLTLPDKKKMLTATDERGMYRFQYLIPGAYEVNEVPAKGWIQTAPPKPGKYMVKIDAKDSMGLDFGNCGGLSISGSSYYDRNANRKREANESGIERCIIQLMLPDRNMVNITLDPKGNYKFGNLPPGSYSVREIVPPGWTLTTPPKPGIHNIKLDSRDATGKDFGNMGTLSIEGTKFNDLNGNAVKDKNDPGIPGWSISLKDPSGKLIAETFTDKSGRYIFKNLPPGEFVVAESAKAGWVQTAPKGGSYKVILKGKPESGKDFANHGILSISGTVFNDVNRNTRKEGAELGLVGWTIQIEEPSGKVVGRNATTAGGAYKFMNLPPGNYTLREIVQAGWEQNAPVSRAYVVNLSRQNISGKDFGNIVNLSISGTNFNDLNSNSKRDIGEPGLMGWRMSLKRDSKVIASNFTDKNGSYSFLGLTSGNYTVSQEEKRDWNQTFPSSPGTHYVKLANADAKRKDFGNIKRLPV